MIIKHLNHTSVQGLRRCEYIIMNTKGEFLYFGMGQGMNKSLLVIYKIKHLYHKKCFVSRYDFSNELNCINCGNTYDC